MKAWTLRPSDDADIPTVIALARPGMTLAAWREAAHADLPQARSSQRERVIRTALELLDLDGEVLAPSAFLQVFNAPGVSAYERRDVLRARRFAVHPWILTISREVLLPALAAAEQPLAERKRVITPEELDTFIDRHLDPCSATARAATRRSIVRALRALGTLTRFLGSLHVNHANPAPIAGAWMLAWQIAAAGGIAMYNRDARTSSDAAAAFAMTPSYVDLCIAAGEHAKILVQSYLMSAGRLYLPEPG